MDVFFSSNHAPVQLGVHYTQIWIQCLSLWPSTEAERDRVPHRELVIYFNKTYHNVKTSWWCFYTMVFPCLSSSVLFCLFISVFCFHRKVSLPVHGKKLKRRQLPPCALLCSRNNLSLSRPKLQSVFSGSCEANSTVKPQKLLMNSGKVVFSCY